MERFFRPERLDIDSNSVSASKEWTHWFQTFQNFIEVLPEDNLNKLVVLTNFVNPKIYECISDCATYDNAIDTLKTLFVKPPNEILTRQYSLLDVSNQVNH